MLRFKSLGSGSTGNATVVEARSDARTTRLLIDCGLGIRQLDLRLEQAGMAAADIDAVFITHEHGDHIGCALQFARRQRVPVWMSQGTYAAIGQPDFEGLLRIACDAVAVEIGALQILPFTVPHDAREPLQLTCGDGAVRMGVLTDLGHATSHVLEQIAGCHALLLECNHDPEMLAGSHYPAFLKRRVGGPWGHLANWAAADIAQSTCHSGLKHVVAAHLSQHNNNPVLARLALATALGCNAGDIAVADAASGSTWFDV
jgi:phosphoribosyl 1,2-cyclic phosphodiesterase